MNLILGKSITNVNDHIAVKLLYFYIFRLNKLILNSITNKMKKNLEQYAQ